MSMTVKLSDELLAEAKRHASAFSRSVPKQIEHWAKIGRIAGDNPDLPYSFIAGILLAKQEVEDAQVTPYQFG